MAMTMNKDCDGDADDELGFLFLSLHLRGFLQITPFLYLLSMMNPSPVVLPNDLISEVLSILPVKSILRFKCVSNHWRTLISDHAFVKLHIKRSKTRIPFLTLVIIHTTEMSLGGIHSDCSVVPYPIRSLLDNPTFTLFDDPYYHLKNKGCDRIVGSCNGLILLAGTGYLTNFNHISKSKNIDNWFRVWNPATMTTSKKFGYYRAFGDSQRYNFAFGWDNLKDSYKVVAYRYNHQFISHVRILNIDDDVWRNVESLPAVPTTRNTQKVFMATGTQGYGAT
ncbi:F-box/kelch-repeat protein At3g23880-like [Vicia villosa]|uniref:F-box/kelch-repeat protein At3g23880-like n=1 Tax=Vicia villosa TaxID=3911 RepID=UPI00273A8A54|nr:F-box/kelch-repeat protein At3g23880-like [Vicia villosa]